MPNELSRALRPQAVARRLGRRVGRHAPVCGTSLTWSSHPTARAYRLSVAS